MPSRTLPTLPSAEVAAHNTAKSCYVTIGTKVYDITDFLEDHPGGGDLILEYGGKDVKEAMEDMVSHAHSEAAYEVLDDHLIGFVATEKVLKSVMKSDDPFAVLPMEPSEEGMAELDGDAKADVNARENVKANGVEQEDKAVYESTGLSSAEDLEKETDATQDYRKYKFLDLNRPLFMQILNGGFSKDFYLQQVHRPRHYPGGDSAPLFGNFLEPLSKTPWWVVPTIWGPCISYGTYIAGLQLHPLELIGYWIFGLCFWTIVEYGLHRCLFHVDYYLPDNRFAITLHFLLHGIHHYLPMDRLRLVMPPTLFVVLAIPFWYFAHAIIFWSWYGAVAAYSGGIFGYICYDMTHYFLHHKKYVLHLLLPLINFALTNTSSLPLHYRELKKYHLQHHFMDYENGFGVTSRFWDRVFGTELPPPPMPKVMKTS